MLRALIYEEQSRRNEAIAELRRVVALRPDMVDARLHLSTYMLSAGNAAEAVPLLEGALAYEPSNPLLHLNLGDAYRLQGRPLEALKQLDWVTKAAPNMPETYYNIGLVYLFSKTVGSLSEVQSAERAILAFETYLRKRGGIGAGGSDDAEELLDRAKNRKAVLDAMNAQPSPEVVQ
jgi:tetratricopeptide (TPR) repeat protein